MSDRNSFPRFLLISIFLAFLIALAGLLVINTAKNSRINDVVYGSVSDFALEDQNGNIFHSQEMKGRIWIVDFIFTNCPNACPVMSGHMSELYRLYAPSDKVHFLSISVDPERDTVAVLKQYAESQGVNDDRWRFCRGPIGKIISLSENVFLLAAENLPMGHSTKFILVDENRNIRGYFDALNENEVERLKIQVRELARKMK